jgi:hypothetical protein
MQPVVVFYEAQFLKFIHEIIDARARGTYHLRQHLLRYFGKRSFGFIPLAVATASRSPIEAR